MTMLLAHALCLTLSSMYCLKYASDFREFSDGFYVIACGLINFANVIVLILKVPKIFNLIDDFEAAIAKSMFAFQYFESNK